MKLFVIICFVLQVSTVFGQVPDPPLSPSKLIFIGFTAYGKQFYTQNVLLNLTQAEEFCSQYTLNIASVDTYDEGVMLGQWATTLNYQEYVISSYQEGLGVVPFQSLNCAESSRVNQTVWNSASCDGLGHPLCVTNYTNPNPNPAPPTSEELTLIGISTVGLIKKEFYGYRPPSKWSDAYDVCKSRGLQLATIDRDEDQFTIVRWSVTTATATWSSFWIAGTAKLTGDWLWISNGQDVPLPNAASNKFQWWAEGQPRTDPTGQTCLATFLGSDRSWYPAPCWQGRPALCMRVSSING
ncbi:uncharacterized protein LOC118435080 [Folsomia candida]|uniref:uncharacterized protein LOC118435080 n=1 Tax=Folsomia candida TaxID=158441 RepID=UPI0016052A94|nr:uncharacterized protein LOC118435080 [Folsomia candida]